MEKEERMINKEVERKRVQGKVRNQKEERRN